MKTICIKIIFTVLFFCTGLQEADSQCIFLGPQPSASTSNNTSTGAIGWSNLSNLGSVDYSYTSCGVFLGILGSANTNYLSTKGYGFSVPATSTVCGIEVVVSRSASGLLIGSFIKDNAVYLIKGGSIVGTNHMSSSSWPGSNALVTYGNSSDLWGTTWTPAEVNASDFGMVMSAKLNAGLVSLFLTANVDMVGITVYYSSKTLDINLNSFTGKVVEDKVKLEWQTTTEKNNGSFMLEKMNDQNEWNVIHTVKGAGNSIEAKNYEVYDENLSEINYYRLKQMDYNNAFTYSSIISVEYDPLKEPVLTIYPVPAGNYLNIDVPGEIEHIEIISPAGSVSVPAAITNESHKVDVSSLAAGLYLVKVYTHKHILTKKFLKE